MSVCDIEFTKPKKSSDNTYSSQLYVSAKSKRKVIKKKFGGVKLIGKKKIGNDFVILLKGKSLQSFMCDINSHIISSVKNNYQNWFSSNMDAELIDDYFSSTIICNKEHGNIIKLLCTEVKTDMQNLQDGTLYNFELVFSKLRFFKQKFVLEVSLLSCEHDTSATIFMSDNDIDSDEDVPEPDHEEVLNMKNKYIQLMDNSISNLKKKLEEIISKRNNLQGLNNNYDILKACEAIENTIQ